MAKITDIIENAIKTGDRSTPITLVTHCSVPRFHADETAATAILKILFRKYNIACKVHHTYTPEEDGYTDETPNCVVYDIGLGMYDHHQKDGENEHCLRKDKDGVIRKYSSIGLIWKEIGHYLVPDEYIDEVYNNIIKPIDDNDNGFRVNPLSYAITQLNAAPNSKYNNLEMFNVAGGIFELIFNHIFDNIQCKKDEEEATNRIINKAKEQGKNYVVTDAFMPSMAPTCSKQGIAFYIYPNIRDHEGYYCFRTINVPDGEMNEHIIDIPQEVREWEGVTFLHPSAFLGSAVSKERAIEIVETIIKNNN